MKRTFAKAQSRCYIFEQLNINILREICLKVQSKWKIDICRELLIPSFENFNGTVSNQEKSFFHSPVKKSHFS